MRLYHLKFRAIERGLHECAVVRPGKTLLLRSASEDIMPQRRSAAYSSSGATLESLRDASPVGAAFWGLGGIV